MATTNTNSRRLRGALLLLGVVVVLLVGFTGYQALKAKTSLELVAADFDTLRTQLAAGDEPGARATLADSQGHASDAVGNTSGPGWWLSARLPQIGPNVRAVRSVALVADSLASDVLPDVVSATATLTPERLKPVDGRIDLDPIRAVAPGVVRAAGRLAAESQRAEAIDTTVLAPQIAEPVTGLQSRVAEAAALADRASRAVRLLPTMLGGEGRRQYLFMFQNNAEVRATGGIPGAFAVLTAVDGKVKLGRQDDASTIAPLRNRPVPVTAEEKDLFGEAMGIFPQDVNFTPDFPRSAELLSAMYRSRSGRSVDGVVSVDPVALSYVLRGTGPVATARRQDLSADTVVELLLSRVYADIPDPARQNVFFNAAARSVFEAAASGTGDPRTVLQNIALSASERRLLVWSAHPEEQDVLAPTSIAGGLELPDPERPHVGVYLNSALPYKLDYYLDSTTTVTSTTCTRGRQQLQVEVLLSSQVPASFRSLPEYVAPKDQQFGRGVIATTLYFFAPAGAEVTGLSVDGTEQEPSMQRFGDRPVFARTVTVQPGGRTRLLVDVTTAKSQTGDPLLRVTPGVRSTGIGEVAGSACS